MAVQFTRGTLAQWTASGKVLLAGQLGILWRSDGTYETRVGNGSDVWAALPLSHSVGKGELVLNVLDWGMVNDAVQLDDISITAGTNQMVSPSATFTSADIGKAIGLTQAGTSGGTLTSSPSGAVRTIASVVDTHTITFDDPLHGTAGTTVVGARTCTGSITRGTNTLTSSDAAFTSSDRGKSITVTGMTGDDFPELRSEFGQATAGSPTLTLTYAGFTSADVGKYVRLTRAGLTGTAWFHVAKITAVGSATSATMDTNASTTAADCQVVMLGAPRDVPVKIVSVTNSTTVVLQRFADFTVSSASCSITGGSTVYGTNNQTALTALVAAAPAGSTLYHPPGWYFIANSSVTISKALTFTGDGPLSGGYHLGTSGTRFVAGADGVRWRGLAFRALPAPSVQVWGVGSVNYSGWRFDDVRFLDIACTLSSVGTVSTVGAVASTGTGIVNDVIMSRVEVTGCLSLGLTVTGRGTVRLIDPYVHDLGVDAASVGIKIAGGARAYIRGSRVSRCIGDAMDLFDAYGVDLADARHILNGGSGCEVKWSNAANYNNSEAQRIRGGTFAYNWTSGMTLAAPRCSIVDVLFLGNTATGVSLHQGVVGNTASTRYTSLSHVEASGNGTQGIALNPLADYVKLMHVVADQNGQYGIYNASLNNAFHGVTAFNNKAGGIDHDSTAKYALQTSCQTQDTNGQCIINASAVGIAANGYGEEAAGSGSAPSLANWPVGATVKNTSDSTVWVRGLSAFTKIA